MGFCLNHAWLSQEFSIFFYFARIKGIPSMPSLPSPLLPLWVSIPSECRYGTRLAQAYQLLSTHSGIPARQQTKNAVPQHILMAEWMYQHDGHSNGCPGCCSSLTTDTTGKEAMALPNEVASITANGRDMPLDEARPIDWSSAAA